MKKQTVRPAEGLNARFERKMRNSFLARFLLFLGGLQDSLQKSAVGGFFRKLGKRLNVEGRFLRPFKYTFAREIEQSLIFNAIDRFFKLLLILPLRVYGHLCSDLLGVQSGHFLGKELCGHRYAVFGFRVGVFGGFHSDFGNAAVFGQGAHPGAMCH